MGPADLAGSPAGFYPSVMKHWVIGLLVVITMAAILPGCTAVVNDVDPPTAEPSSGSAPHPPVSMLPPAVATPTLSAVPDP